jgi:2-oxoglutarate dehydrogenase E2 component (dihydrolipoamide succinyltransferase)
MVIEVKIPEVGESITEGVLVEWSVADGAHVSVDEPLLVVETDKITVSVNADAAGLLKQQVEEGETVQVGQVVATIDTSSQPEPAAETAAKEPEPRQAEPEPVADDGPPVTAPAGMAQAHERLAGLDGLSPAVQRMVVEHHLDPSAIQGTGRRGRLTKEDVVNYLAGQEQEARPAATKVATPPVAETPKQAERAEVSGERRQTRKRMTPLRFRIAERLLQVQQGAAILTTFNEADMSRVIALRKDWRQDFKARHDVDLGFMSFFIRATVEAIKTVPEVNAFIEGDEVVSNHYVDIGIAVSTDKGLVVPVIRDADRMTMAGLERRIIELADKARQRTLELSDLVGATFTISNGGVFGSMLSTPILNPPGSAILGMHAIKKRPVVVDDEIVIRPMMYLALSYDHRLIDGREAVTFLKRIVECIESPERMLLEV